MAVLASLAFVSAHAGEQAAQYHLQSFTVDGGTAVVSEGGGFRLAGSVGQPDAGKLSGSGFTLRGGFWPAAVLATGDGIFDDGFEVVATALANSEDAP